MMKKAWFPMLALTAILSLRLTSFSVQEPSKDPGANAQDTPQVVSATITQVDTASNLLTVETTDKRHGTLKVDSDTNITIGGKKAKLSDLKEGMQAKIAFNRQSKALSIDA